MQKHRLKFNKLVKSFSFLTLIIASNNADLSAKYINNPLKKLNNSNFEYQHTNPQEFFFIKNTLLVENDNAQNEGNVLISEIIIQGWENHPEGRKLELAAYDAMSIKPGSVVNNQILKRDLNSIYASGWFSGVKIKSEDGPLGAKLIIDVVPNPILKDVTVIPSNSLVQKSFVDKVFKKYYGTTLNLNDFQKRIQIIKEWYEENGFSLARINGPERISKDGVVELKVDEGVVSKINFRFLGADNEPLVDGKPRKGKTKDWVIRRELKTSPGSIFNRKTLEADIKRLYATSLFNDIKVSLGPDNENIGQVIITLDISEQRTGSLTGGLGFSNSSGIFAQIGLQETNAFGRAWSTNLNLNFGEYSTTYNFSVYDPWIKGDKHKTAFRSNIFLSRDYPQEFRSDKSGKLYGVRDFYNAGTSTATEIAQGSHATVEAAKNADSSTSWFDYKGDSIVLENAGGGFSFSRPLNGGDPFKVAPWKVLVGLNYKTVKMIDSDGNKRPYAMPNSTKPTTAQNVSEIICIGYTAKDGSCPSENSLVSFVTSASYSNVNNAVNPTAGNKFNIGSEQFISVSTSSPTFNRMRASYAWFIPVKLINLTKGCKSSDSDNISCPQTIGFQFKTGTIVGDLPPYEAFCMGGSSSVRGWGSCDLAVSRSFAEASAEYRFPLWRMISGSLFADAGSDLGSQNNVPGKPGKLLNKEGSGFSLGGGLGIKTPIGPLRFDAASQDLSGNMRYTLGVGWKF